MGVAANASTPPATHWPATGGRGTTLSRLVIRFPNMANERRELFNGGVNQT